MIPKQKKKQAVKAEIFLGAGGWGYDILVDDKIFIHQESVPVIAGSKGFKEKQQAEKTAALIINKIENGEPPVVTTFELRKIIPLNEQ